MSVVCLFWVFVCGGVPDGRGAEGGGYYGGAGSAVGGDVAVFGQALVGLGDDASGDAEFGGEDSGGWEAAADGEAAVGDRCAELFGQPGREAACRDFAERELEEVGTDFGPLS
jgi:hypothetical protein